MNSRAHTVSQIASSFAEAGCTGTLHALALSSGAQIGVEAEDPMVMASVFKAIVALEFYDQAEAGELDPAQLVAVDPTTATS